MKKQSACQAAVAREKHAFASNLLQGVGQRKVIAHRNKTSRSILFLLSGMFSINLTYFKPGFKFISYSVLA